MSTSRSWYETVQEIKSELEIRLKRNGHSDLDLMLKDQINKLVKLFNDCEYVGFPKTDPEAVDIISNLLTKIKNAHSKSLEFVPENPFFNLYLDLCYLEKVLTFIKRECENNLNTTLEHLESIIYKSNDYQNLVEVSRNIGRRIINKKQHPEFGKLKQHIAEQLEYIERNNKFQTKLSRNKKYPKIKALFQFIEYLHSNIDNFNQYNSLIKELEQLNKERNKLKPLNNYKDKQQYDKVQAELESKFKTLQDNTANLIKAKARELNVCNFENEPNYNFNGVETEIRQLKDNFSDEDLPEIFKHKSQYIEYRGNTHGTFLSLQFFFDELDEITKSLFDYFKDTDRNEFEEFEIKAIPVNSIQEAIQGFKKGQTKFTLSSSVLFNTSSNEKQKNEAIPPQRTEKQKPEPKETELSEKIRKHFGFLLKNCPRKGKQILTNENDFNQIIAWTTYFYKNNFEVPKISEPIKSVNTNIYITQLAYQLLFVELRKTGFHSQKRNAKTLFNLWESSFLDYKGYKESNFWKVKKKNDNGIDYDTEVKKLMLIE